MTIPGWLLLAYAAFLLLPLLIWKRLPVSLSLYISRHWLVVFVWFNVLLGGTPDRTILNRLRIRLMRSKNWTPLDNTLIGLLERIDPSYAERSE